MTKEELIIGFFEKGYCCDLDEVKDTCLGLIKENKELKKQLEEINKMIEKCGFVNIEQVMLNYCGLLSQQKEFISYLENEIEKKRKKTTTLTSFTRNVVPLKHCLQKYEEIIGGKHE